MELSDKFPYKITDIDSDRLRAHIDFLLSSVPHCSFAVISSPQGQELWLTESALARLDEEELL